MDQVGVITKIYDNKAEIEVKRMSACGENCKGCASSCDVPGHVIVLENNINAKVGDTVEVQGKTSEILKLTMIVYLVPFTLMLIGIFSGLKIFKNMGIENYEPLSFVLGLVFLGIGYFFIRLFDNSFGKKENKTIIMTRII